MATEKNVGVVGSEGPVWCGAKRQTNPPKHQKCIKGKEKKYLNL